MESFFIKAMVDYYKLINQEAEAEVKNNDDLEEMAVAVMANLIAEVKE